MPGAFTKTCSAIHLPGYIKNYETAKKKGVSKIVCVAVNDPNVMKAWGENQGVGDKIFMIGVHPRKQGLHDLIARTIHTREY